jgi:translation initiation factor 5A
MLFLPKHLYISVFSYHVMGDVKQIDATHAKPGKYVVFDGQACIVKNLEISRPGKHGHAKCRIEAVTIKEGKKIIKIMPGHDSIDSPIIEKKQAQVLSVIGEKANVMDIETYETFDITIPEEFREKLAEGSQVLYWIVLDEKIVKEVKST